MLPGGTPAGGVHNANEPAAEGGSAAPAAPALGIRLLARRSLLLLLAIQHIMRSIGDGPLAVEEGWRALAAIGNLLEAFFNREASPEGSGVGIHDLVTWDEWLSFSRVERGASSWPYP